ncbi:TfoX/Sxy family DNA transformation protein [Anaerorhabdus furcosa]|uniref:DNA transformation protein n=1 Tax=Anaerorhabdus furcosa TaxID=118967 RepID=A0A1T4Q243_9FIRM|nr:TfoX/Sxy family DNA transformation protein [Anaerorhabdus furcosa]SJZ97853.1 DNA transformation protein [Anaerorhabdus furcosa]
MTALTSMKNIGKEMKKKLESVGIDSVEKLKCIGSKDAFIHLRMKYSNICLVHLYTLQGAIDDIEYHNLPENMKSDLKKFSKELK